MKMRTITCFGDRTSGTFLVIASVSDEKKTYQKGKEKKKNTDTAWLGK